VEFPANGKAAAPVRICIDFAEDSDIFISLD
jgi:hypothetical protein